MNPEFEKKQAEATAVINSIKLEMVCAAIAQRATLTPDGEHYLIPANLHRQLMKMLEDIEQSQPTL